MNKLMNGNIASLKIKNGPRDPYTNALRIARGMNCRYYGQLDDKLILSQQKEELKKMEIDYLITWNNTEWGNIQPVYFNPELGVNIFSVK